MPVEITDRRLVFLPEEKFLTASGIVMAFHDRWWAAHPETNAILFFHAYLRSGKLADICQASPQCNSNQTTAEIINKKLYPWASLRFVPLVLQPIDIRDYTQPIYIRDYTQP